MKRKLTESKLRQLVREELKRELNEASNPAEIAIEIRRVLQNDVNSRMNKIIKSLEREDPDMAGWAKDIQEDVQDVMDELFDFGNKISISSGESRHRKTPADRAAGRGGSTPADRARGRR